MRAIANKALDIAWPGHPATPQEVPARILPILTSTGRMTAAAVIALLLTRWLTMGPIDLTSALSALLAIQASAATSVRNGMVRIFAVACGVAMAIAVSVWFGMHWWSLGLVVFFGLLAGKVLRLGDNQLEVPISAMLILGSAGSGVAAENRVLATVIGSLVGMAVPLLFPPTVPFRSVSAAVRLVAEDINSVLVKAGKELTEHNATREVVESWLVETRRITGQIAKVHTRIASLSDIRRYNSRAAGTADVEPILRSGLESIEHCLISLRATLLSMSRAAPDSSSGDQNWIPHDTQVRLGAVLTQLGGCLAAFGTMVEAEANGNEDAAEKTFARNYRAVRDARAELRSLMEDQTRFDELWVLQGSLLTGIDQMLAQMDLDARLRVRHLWKSTQLGRRLPEAYIGPRTSSIDRFRMARMKARHDAASAPGRQARHLDATTVDFISDDEVTQEIPRITAEIRRTPVRASRRPNSRGVPTVLTSEPPVLPRLLGRQRRPRSPQTPTMPES